MSDIRKAIMARLGIVAGAVKDTFAADAGAVAKEILRQLGGGRFMSMVGGKNAMHGMFNGKPGLQVSIGKGAEGGINRLIVTLDPATDTYDMEFWRIASGGLSTKKVSEARGVYADDLQRIFTDRTKFYTSMSRPGAKATMGTNKRVIRHAGHEFLAEDEGNRTRISVKVDGAWEHATTVNTDNQTATEWIEANAKPGPVSRWLPSAHSRPGAKARMQKEYVLWGIPKGKTSALDEQVLSTQAKTPAQMDAIKKRAAADGWHSFRVQILDLSKPYKGFGFSRPGAKARMAAAEWMQDVRNMLRDLTKERQRVQVWVAGPTTVKVAGMWLAHNRWGTGAAIASRIAYYMTQAAGTPGNYSSQETNDSPKKGTNTIVYTVPNVPKDAVDYLKAWGIGTSPKSFAGFKGESTVAYSRPGAKATMGVAKDYDLAVTDAEYAALIAGDALDKRILGDSLYQITTEDRAIRERANAAKKSARDRSDNWHRMWERATTDAERATIEARANEAEAKMRKYRVRTAKHRASRPGAKATNALSDACWEGYEAVGTKQQDGKTVPNCVPKTESAKPSDLEREDVKAGLKLMEKSDPKVSEKIRTLIKEGKPQDQAVAIALDMKRRGEL